MAVCALPERAYPLRMVQRQARIAFHRMQSRRGGALALPARAKVPVFDKGRGVHKQTVEPANDDGHCVLVLFFAVLLHCLARFCGTQWKITACNSATGYRKRAWIWFAEIRSVPFVAQREKSQVLIQDKRVRHDAGHDRVLFSAHA